MTDSRLVVPEGLVIDEVARERLTRQLERQPAAVKGVAAEAGVLPPGASYRVHAEWRSLEPLSAFVPSSAAVRGAVLVRPNVRFEVSDGLVGVDGTIVIDNGAHVHDPWAPVGPLLDASESGRPPFPRRPVVVFAALEIDPVAADWARRMVNRLVRRDVEARLALPATDDGLHLTRPCLPGAKSIRALAPDVIVTLDAGAADQAPDWCRTDRSTVLVELVDDPTIVQELVSWQIDHARGRVRARISRRVGAPSLASLVHRLSAGPQPAPPTDQAADVAVSLRVRENWGSRIAARPMCVVVTGAPSRRASARLEGLVDHLEASGVRVAHVPQERTVPPGARAATLMMLVGVDASPSVSELIEERTAQHLPTVLEVDPAAVSVSHAGSTESIVVSPPVAQLAVECGYVVTPTEAVRTAMPDLQVRTLVIPAMLTRARAAALRNAGLAPAPHDGTVIGLYVGSADEASPDYLDAVAEGLAKVLADRTDLRVDVVGDADRLPVPLRHHERVSFEADSPQPEMLARWALHVWTPRILGGQDADDLGTLVQASFAGVPSLLPLPARRGMDGVAAPELVVSRYDEPEGWATALSRLLGEDRTLGIAAREARLWSHTVHGSAACRASVNRLLGWARYEVRS